MAILLFILRLIGWVLLAVLVLLLIALFFAAGAAAVLSARLTPGRSPLWPAAFHPSGHAAARGPSLLTSPQSLLHRARRPRSAKLWRGDKDSVTVRVEPEQPAARRAPQPTTADTNAAPSAAAAPKARAKRKRKKKSTGGLPLGISARIDAAMQLLTDDPMAFARCMLGHTGWLGRQLLRAVRIRHLDIFWTAHTKEAASTAELYGAELALFNNLLALCPAAHSLQKRPPLAGA